MQEQERRRRECEDLRRIYFAAAEKIIFGTAKGRIPDPYTVVKGDVVRVVVVLRFGDLDGVLLLAAELRGGEVDCGLGGLDLGICGDKDGAARSAPRRREQRVFCWWRLQGGYSVMSRVSRQ